MAKDPSKQLASQELTAESTAASSSQESPSSSSSSSSTTTTAQLQVATSSSSSSAVASSSKADAAPRQLLEFEQPIYGIAVSRAGHVILVGGGGSSKTGVKNAIHLFQWTTDLPLDQQGLVTKCTFGGMQNAPMNVAVHPSGRWIACGEGEFLKVYVAEEDGAITRGGSEGHSVQSDFLPSSPGDSFQKVVRYAKDGSFLVTGGADGCLRCWTFPGLDCFDSFLPALPKDFKRKREAVRFLDLFSSDGPSDTRLLATYQSEIVIFRFCSFDPSRRLDEIAQEAPRPSSSDSVVLSVRPANSGDRFQGGVFSRCGQHFFTIQTQPKRPSSVTRWSISSGRPERSRVVFSKEQCSNFALSGSGQHLAVASSQGSVALLNTSSLSIVWSLPQLHEWVITSIAFTPNDNFVITSGLSRDVRVTSIHQSPPRSSIKYLLTLIFVVMAFVFLIFGQFPLAE